MALSLKRQLRQQPSDVQQLRRTDIEAPEFVNLEQLLRTRNAHASCGGGSSDGGSGRGQRSKSASRPSAAAGSRGKAQAADGSNAAASATETAGVTRGPDSCIIGRHQDCDIVLNSTALPYLISRYHAKLTRMVQNGDEGDATNSGNVYYVLENLSETNGTYINGSLMQGCLRSKILCNDDVIAFGPKNVTTAASSTSTALPFIERFANPFVYAFHESASPSLGLAAAEGGTTDTKMEAKEGAAIPTSRASLRPRRYNAKAGSTHPAMDGAGPRPRQEEQRLGKTRSESSRAERERAGRSDACGTGRGSAIGEERGKRDPANLPGDAPARTSTRNSARQTTKRNHSETAAPIDDVTKIHAGSVAKRRKTTADAAMVKAGTSISLSNLGAADLTNDLQCSICQDVFCLAHTMECSHTFCGDCLFEWLQRKRVCPVCREPCLRPPIHVRNLDGVIEKTIEPQLGTAERLQRKTRAETFEANKAKILDTFEKPLPPPAEGAAGGTGTAFHILTALAGMNPQAVISFEFDAGELGLRQGENPSRQTAPGQPRATHPFGTMGAPRTGNTDPPRPSASPQGGRAQRRVVVLPRGGRQSTEAGRPRSAPAQPGGAARSVNQRQRTRGGPRRPPTATVATGAVSDDGAEATLSPQGQPIPTSQPSTVGAGLSEDAPPASRSNRNPAADRGAQRTQGSAPASRLSQPSQLSFGFLQDFRSEIMRQVYDAFRGGNTGDDSMDQRRYSDRFPAMVSDGSLRAPSVPGNRRSRSVGNSARTGRGGGASTQGAAGTGRTVTTAYRRGELPPSGSGVRDAPSVSSEQALGPFTALAVMAPVVMGSNVHASTAPSPTNAATQPPSSLRRGFLSRNGANGSGDGDGTRRPASERTSNNSNDNDSPRTRRNSRRGGA